MFIYWLVIDGLVYEWCVKLLGSIDGLGTKRIFGIYIGIIGLDIRILMVSAVLRLR